MVQEMINGYNNFVSTLKLVRKHRPFAENDHLPKICQPEDHIEVSSPRSTESEQANLEFMENENEDFIALNEQASDNKTPNNQGDPGSGGPNSEEETVNSSVAAQRPEMGPCCNLKSMFYKSNEAAA